MRRSSGKPFSNYQKYDAMRTALRDHSIHITSVGPYISKFEQKNFDEQDARAKSTVLRFCIKLFSMLLMMVVVFHCTPRCSRRGRGRS